MEGLTGSLSFFHKGPVPNREGTCHSEQSPKSFTSYFPYFGSEDIKVSIHSDQ